MERGDKEDDVDGRAEIPDLERRKQDDQRSSIRDSRTAVLCVVALAIFTDLVVYGVVIPTLPRLIQTKFPGLGPFETGCLFAAYAFGLLFLSPVIAIWSDRHKNRKLPMLLGTLGLVLSTAGFGFGNQFWQLVVARCCQGISAAVTWTIGMCMIADLYPTDMLGTMMAYTNSASTAGMMIGPPLGGVLYSSISPEAPYIFCSALAGFDFLLRLWVRPERAVKYCHEEEQEQLLNNHDQQQQISSSSSESASSAQSNSMAPIAHRISMINLLQDFQFLATFLSICIEAGTYSGVELVLSIHLSHHFKYSPYEIGLMFMALVLPDVLSAILIGPISDRYGRKNISAIGLALLGASLIILPFANETWSIAGALVLQGIGAAVAVTPNSPELAEIIDDMGSSDYAQVYALYNVAYSLGMLVGPTVAGALYDQFGFLVCMFVFAGLMFLWTPVVMAAWIIGRRKANNVDDNSSEEQ